MASLPFDSIEENEKYKKLYNETLKNLDKMTLSNHKDIQKFVEILSSALLLEFNKILPEPNYSIYLTYRFKSPKSNIHKLNDYLSRKSDKDDDNSIKTISDLIGLRLIIEKIPHNISINKNNPEYDYFKQIINERNENIKYSEQLHDFENNISSNNCTKFEYYSTCKDLIEHIINMLEINDDNKKSTSENLKDIYNNLLKDCNTMLEYLKQMGDYSSKINFKRLLSDMNNKIDFSQLLKDFDSRIDSKLALKLYSNSFKYVVSNSEIFKSLGVSVSSDSNRTKEKREQSGFVADFYGLDFEKIPVECELQIMSINEYLASCMGYSAHSKMPGKDTNLIELPSAHTNRLLSLTNNLGKSSFITNEELKVIKKIMEIKTLDESYYDLIKELVSPSNVVIENNISTGININETYLSKLQDLCTLNDLEKKSLKSKLDSYSKKSFTTWSDNISATQAIARLDKDSSAKNRVKIHYDTPYERLANTIRQQSEGYNVTSSIELIDTYLSHLYKNQKNWFISKKTNTTETSVMEFEISDYIDEILPNLNITLNSKEYCEDEYFEK